MNEDSDLDAVIDLALTHGALPFEVLAEVAFTSETFHLWTGVGSRPFGEHTWHGVGNIVSVSDAARSENGQADPFEIVLTPDPDLIRIGLIDFEAEAKGRVIRLFLQFFTPGTSKPVFNPETGQEVGPWQFQEGIMRGATYAIEEGTESLTIRCDTLTSYRGRPAYGMLTDRHQQALHPGDVGLEDVKNLANREITWPDF